MMINEQDRVSVMIHGPFCVIHDARGGTPFRIRFRAPGDGGGTPAVLCFDR